jgi:hypothetical protein
MRAGLDSRTVVASRSRSIWLVTRAHPGGGSESEAHRGRRTPGPRVRELVKRQPAGGLGVAEAEVHERRSRAPGQHRRVGDAALGGVPTARRQVGERLGRPSLLVPRPSPGTQQHVGRQEGRSAVVEADPFGDLGGSSELALLDEHLDQMSGDPRATHVEAVLKRNVQGAPQVGLALSQRPAEAVDLAAEAGCTSALPSSTGRASSAAPANSPARSPRDDLVASASNSWRAIPKGNSRSNSLPRACSSPTPASRAAAQHSSRRLVLPAPGGPSTSTSEGRPRRASPRARTNLARSASRSNSRRV